MKNQDQFENRILLLLTSTLGLLAITVMIGLGLMYILINPASFSPTIQETASPILPVNQPEEKIENGIDVASGFIAQGDYQLVRTVCTACHSGKLVLQNRATREGWKDMIVWMQETQKLWDLGENEDKILDYLAEHYAPAEVGRRSNLTIGEWYEIR